MRKHWNFKHGELKTYILDLASKTGYSASMVYQIRYGEKRPSVDQAAKLEKSTGIPMIAWLYPEKNPNPFIIGK